MRTRRDALVMSLMESVVLGYDRGLRYYGRVLDVGFTLNHPELQLGRAGPPAGTRQLCGETRRQ